MSGEGGFDLAEARERLYSPDALEQYREWTGPVGPVDIGVEHCTVPHRHRHVGFQLEGFGIWHGAPPPEPSVRSPSQAILLSGRTAG